MNIIIWNIFVHWMHCVSCSIQQKQSTVHSKHLYTHKTGLAFPPQRHRKDRWYIQHTVAHHRAHPLGNAQTINQFPDTAALLSWRWLTPPALCSGSPAHEEHRHCVPFGSVSVGLTLPTRTTGHTTEVVQIQAEVLHAVHDLLRLPHLQLYD